MATSLSTLERELAADVARALDLRPGDVDSEATFSDLGVDSLIAVRWIEVINARYGLQVSASVLYYCPTIRQLAVFLEAERSRLSAPADPPAPQEGSTPQATGGPVVRESQGATAIQASREEAIAIIGIAGQFPGARNVEEFWSHVASGRDCISEVPEERWSNAFYDADAAAPGRTYSNSIGLLEGIDQFDPLFFNISPAEAEWMEPRQRLFLENCWRCLEDAGIRPSSLWGRRCGVFVGCRQGDYGQTFDGDALTAQRLLGESCSILAARIAYFLNLHGPCMAIDTACSSSLVAVAQACDSLLLRRSDVALAGGACVLVGPAMHVMSSKSGMLSRRGRCFTFDQRADGFVPGEGVGVVLLKRLSDAIRDDDRICGVIRGWGVNQDGKTNGITAPSAIAQADLEQEVYESAGIDPATITLVEAHGTGTKLGDPIEVEALTATFRRFTDKRQYCALGSVKTNIGHLLAAAGIAGLIKVVLALRHRQLPPTINFERTNEHIALEDSPFYINTTLHPWESSCDAPRRAAVSAFGFSGTNAHLVIEEYAAAGLEAETADVNVAAAPEAIILSARTLDRLHAQVDQLLEAIESGSLTAVDLVSLAYTLQVGREAMEVRLGFVATSLDQVRATLRRYRDGDVAADLHVAEVKQHHGIAAVLNGDVDLAQIVERWIAQRKYAKVLAVWVEGVNVDWRRAQDGATPKRISLPTYPFSRNRYWIPGASHARRPPSATRESCPIVVDAPDQSAPHPGRTKADAAGQFLGMAAARDRPQIDQPLGTDIRACTLAALRELFANVSKVASDEIDPDEPLDSYGIDSIMIVRLNQQLADAFRELPPTVFFEHRTLSSLCDYLVRVHPHSCARWTERAVQTPASIAPSLAASLAPTPVSRSPQSRPSLSTDERRSADVSERLHTPVAIIGIAGRYPGAGTLDAFWENLKAGRDSVTEIPAERWPVDDFFAPDADRAVSEGRSYSKWGGFVEGAADFDARFFHISPREAINIDPQERLFLQASWEALEDAGYTREELSSRYSGRVGVFAGVTKTGFLLYGADPAGATEGFTPNTCFAAVANRVSYFLNLHGPSVSVDTMCSASLTAIHQACEQLHLGACEMAIAGGVNLCLHPYNYVRLSAARMLSTDGRCRSFGKDGSGYVPGEGVGALLLKRLPEAIADGDHVYAVIRATSINHGGRTNGYTVPSPAAQRDLIREALDKCGVDARTITYVEAHGTGTRLGDPIEVAGLTQAFQLDTSDTQFCAIGSVKSNIGHLEAASGIAGVTKIILQLQHGLLVPTLHAKELNPHIDFAATPFVVQQACAEWKRVARGEGEPDGPRRAAISSFGAGGANAHAVIEEHVAPVNDRRPRSHPGRPVAIVLSAKNVDRLRARATQLLEALDCHATDAELPDIAYTLQVGREAMESRLALVADSVEAVKAKLRGYLRGDADGLYRGEAKPHKASQGGDISEEDRHAAIQAWVGDGAGRLLALWVNGCVVDWNQLYADGKPRRVSLPTYPFEKERYWIPESCAASLRRSATGGIRDAEGSTRSVDRPPLIGGVSHPLLHRNTSDLTEQRYSCTLTGQEFFLADHVVKGARLLPGVAYLEMVCAAVAAASRSDRAGESTSYALQLTNIVWSRPLIVGDEPVCVHIVLRGDDEAGVRYEIYTVADAPAGVDEGTRDRIVHCHGRARKVTEPPTPAIDLTALRSHCEPAMPASRCYAIFEQMGLTYGPAHRGLETVHRGTTVSGDPFVLTRVRLPAVVAGTHAQFMAHPSLMDAALQATMALRVDLADVGRSFASSGPSLPFALERAEIVLPCPAEGWAHVRRSAGCRAEDPVQKFDIDLCDDTGRISVQLRGFTSRVLNQATNDGVALMAPRWEPQSAAAGDEETGGGRHWTILCDPGLDGGSLHACQEYRARIAAEWPTDRLIVLNGSANVGRDVTDAAVEMLEAVQRLLRETSSRELLIQLVVPTVGPTAMFAGLAGLFKAAHLEHPTLRGQVLAVEPAESADGLVAKLRAGRRTPHSGDVRYERGERMIRRWSEVPCKAAEVVTPWKSGGVYLITGGLGALGLIFAAEIARQQKDATIVLAGRSAPTGRTRARLQALAADGARVDSRVLDVTDAGAADRLCRDISASYGRLDGIIHAAGLLHDRLLLKKTREEFAAVVAPKVDGLVNLDFATRAMPLDLVVLFSSTAAATGSVGQSDYATANAFMDVYARYRNDLVASGTRSGRTVSINWPLWADGGMRVDGAGFERMRQRGAHPLSTGAGIEAFYRIVASGEEHVVVLSGDIARLTKRLDGEPADNLLSSSVPVVAPSDRIATGELIEKLQRALVDAVSESSKVRREDVDVDTEWGEFGFDSVTLTELANTINGAYQLDVGPTLLFEHPTIGRLAAHLIQTEWSRLAAALGVPQA